MFQNFGLPQSTSIRMFFGKIHFWNCHDQEVDKDLIPQKFWFAYDGTTLVENPCQDPADPIGFSVGSLKILQDHLKIFYDSKWIPSILQDL